MSLDPVPSLTTSPQAEMFSRMPAPSHRHAAPSGPWPWIDLSSYIDPSQFNSDQSPVPPPCDHSKCEGKCWKEYPQSLYPNWTADQVGRSKIHDAVTKYDKNQPCQIYIVDVDKNGLFSAPNGYSISETTKETFWNEFLLAERQPNIRVRSLFVEYMSGPALQMLGAKYNVEPFFFSSSLNWIPSRYQEQLQPNEGDHITITLTFLRTMRNPLLMTQVPISRVTTFNSTTESVHGSPRTSRASSATELTTMQAKEDFYADQVIDTQAPLALRSNDKVLLLDLLAIHLVRSTKTSTIISYHPTHTRPSYSRNHGHQHGAHNHHHQYHHHHRRRHHHHGPQGGEQPPQSQPRQSSREIGTSAAQLHTRIRFAGQSVYWQNIFTQSRDPTFVLLTFLWHALYAWDEALETLYSHVCWLETRVINTSDMDLTQELHIIRAHHLHYSALLDDFSKSVQFVLDTPNPAMNSDDVSEEEKQRSRLLLEKECSNLLSEIERLQKGRRMQDQRLKNVMNLVFSTVNIEDSKRMQRLTEAAVRDSAAMKQIAYLTMVFLPASFAAAFFGMNVQEITPKTNGTLAYYFGMAAPLTIITIWIIVAFQSKHWYEDPDGTPLWRRLGWPVMIARRLAGT